jgi:hypothetical protein
MPSGIYQRSIETRLKMRKRMLGHKMNAGRIWSESSKEKVRKFRLGKTLSESAKEKLRIFHTGLKHSDETKTKISLIQTGKIIPSSRLPRMRQVMLGDKNPNWKGGITKKSQEDRASYLHRDWVRKVFERDNYTCKMPGCLSKRGCELNAHHIKTYKNYPNLRTSLSNGITLCVPCHNLTKGKEVLFENIWT